MKQYDIWRRSMAGGQWPKTSHSVKARTDKEAQSRVRQKFAKAGFSGMSLIALPCGDSPT